MLTLYISLFCSFMFLWVQFSGFCNTVLMCLLGYKHKQHLVRFRKRSCFSLKYVALSPETLLENVWMSFKKNFCGFCTYKMLKHSLEPWSRSWQPSHWAVTPPASPRPPNMKVSLYTCNVNVTWSIVEVLWYIWHVDFWTYQESTITATIERTEMIGIKQCTQVWCITPNDLIG